MAEAAHVAEVPVNFEETAKEIRQHTSFSLSATVEVTGVSADRRISSAFVEPPYFQVLHKALQNPDFVDHLHNIHSFDSWHSVPTVAEWKVDDKTDVILSQEWIRQDLFTLLLPVREGIRNWSLENLDKGNIDKFASITLLLYIYDLLTPADIDLCVAGFIDNKQPVPKWLEASRNDTSYDEAVEAMEALERYFSNTLMARRFTPSAPAFARKQNWPRSTRALLTPNAGDTLDPDMSDEEAGNLVSQIEYGQLRKQDETVISTQEARSEGSRQTLADALEKFQTVLTEEISTSQQKDSALVYFDHYFKRANLDRQLIPRLNAFLLEAEKDRFAATDKLLTDLVDQKYVDHLSQPYRQLIAALICLRIFSSTLAGDNSLSPEQVERLKGFVLRIRIQPLPTEDEESDVVEQWTAEREAALVKRFHKLADDPDSGITDYFSVKHQDQIQAEFSRNVDVITKAAPELKKEAMKVMLLIAAGYAVDYAMPLQTYLGNDIVAIFLCCYFGSLLIRMSSMEQFRTSKENFTLSIRPGLKRQELRQAMAKKIISEYLLVPDNPDHRLSQTTAALKLIQETLSSVMHMSTVWKIMVALITMMSFYAGARSWNNGISDADYRDIANIDEETGEVTTRGDYYLNFDNKHTEEHDDSELNMSALSIELFGTDIFPLPQRRYDQYYEYQAERAAEQAEQEAQQAEERKTTNPDAQHGDEYEPGNIPESDVGKNDATFWEFGQTSPDFYAEVSYAYSDTDDLYPDRITAVEVPLSIPTTFFANPEELMAYIEKIQIDDPTVLIRMNLNDSLAFPTASNGYYPGSYLTLEGEAPQFTAIDGPFGSVRVDNTSPGLGAMVYLKNPQAQPNQIMPLFDPEATDFHDQLESGMKLNIDLPDLPPAYLDTFDVARIFAANGDIDLLPLIFIQADQKILGQHYGFTEYTVPVDVDERSELLASLMAQLELICNQSGLQTMIQLNSIGVPASLAVGNRGAGSDHLGGEQGHAFLIMPAVDNGQVIYKALDATLALWPGETLPSALSSQTEPANPFERMQAHEVDEVRQLKLQRAELLIKLTLASLALVFGVSKRRKFVEAYNAVQRRRFEGSTEGISLLQRSADDVHYFVDYLLVALEDPNKSDEDIINQGMWAFTPVPHQEANQDQSEAQVLAIYKQTNNAWRVYDAKKAHFQYEEAIDQLPLADQRERAATILKQVRQGLKQESRADRAAAIDSSSNPVPSEVRRGAGRLSPIKYIVDQQLETHHRQSQQDLYAKFVQDQLQILIRTLEK